MEAREHIERHRSGSDSLGHSQRPAKRMRTGPSTMNSHDHRSNHAGASSATSTRDRHESSGPSINREQSVLVPGGIILPNRDAEGRRTVIDLTEDSPPPRSTPREIIDVDALPDRPESFFPGPEMFFSRQRHPRHIDYLGGGPARPVEPYPLFNRDAFPANYSRFHHHHSTPSRHDISNPILGNGGRMPPGIGSGLGLRHGGTLGSGGNYVPPFLSNGRGPGRAGASFGFVSAYWSGDVASQINWELHGQGGMDIGFEPPVLNYRLGPNGQMGSPPPEDAARQREAEYKAPPPPKEGFTRTPQKDDILVCPSCDYELGTDNGDEVQATVWLGKCGHCYCGKCAAEFRASSRRPARGTGAHSGSCTVCKTKLRGKALWEIFL